MTLTNDEAARLAKLEAAFEIAGGRGVDLAEQIDQLRAKRPLIDGVPPISDETAGTRYEAWTDGRAVGYRVTHANGQVEYIYLNPSSGGSDSADHQPNVFLYIGPDGDPASDDAAHYYDLGGWDAKVPSQPGGPS